MTPQLEKDLRKAHKEILDKTDYAKIAKYSGKEEGLLRIDLNRILSGMLNDFPRTTASIGYGWSVRLIQKGHGAWSVEVNYPVTSQSSLIFDVEKINEAARVGLIDEGGEQALDPPVCYACLRPNDKNSPTHASAVALAKEED